MNRSLAWGLALAWVGLLLAVILAFSTKRRLTTSSKLVKHTQEILIALHRYEALVTRIETDVRGFVMSGDQEFIKDYNLTLSSIGRTHSHLIALVKDNTDQTQRLNVLDDLARRKVAFNQVLISTTRRGARDQALNLITSKQGKVLMDSIRLTAKQAVDYENDLLIARSLQAEETNNTTSTYIIFSLLVSVGMGIVTLALFRRLTKERERSIQGLRDFNSLLEGVFQSSQSGIMVLKALRNGDGEIADLEWVAVNEKASSLLDKHPEALLGKRLMKFMPHHRAINGLLDTYKRVTETGQAIEVEIPCPLGQGQIQWLNISAAPISNGVAITLVDVTSRREDAIRIEQNEANLQALINNTADEVWSVDKNLQLITANHAYLERAMPGHSEWYLKEPLTQALAGTPIAQEFILDEPSGKQRLMSYHFNPVKGADGLVTGVAVFGHDITNQRTAEMRSRQQGQLLDIILKSIPLVVFTLDKDGNMISAEGRGVPFSRAEENPLIGANLLELYPHYQKEIQTALEGKPIHYIWQSDDHDQASQYFDTYLFPSGDNPETITGVALDITPIKRGELELQAAMQRAESASAFKTRFLANMSHEIRTPLTAILGFAEILKREQNSTGHLQYLSHIEAAGTTLLKLIGDILDLTKIEEGKMTLVQESYDLKEVVSSMLHPYKCRAEEKGLEFRLSYVGDTPSQVVGDAGKLVQVIINLVGNALKFTKEGGVCVEFESMLASDDSTLLLTVSISDSGIGIPDEKQASVFAPFSQADDSISRAYGGSGLGLSIASEMINLLGGNLDIESPARHEFTTTAPGTRFFFTIPLRPDRTAEKTEKQVIDSWKEARLSHPYRVLLVEDNLVNQQLAQLILQGVGCTVHLAANGREGAELSLKRHFDLVLMDVQMPVLDGLSATRIIKRLKPNLTIIGLSANVYREDIEACFTAGMDDFLPKPYTSEKLLGMLVKHMPTHMRVLQADLSDTPEKVVSPTENAPGAHLNYLYQLVGQDTNKIGSFLDAFRQVAHQYLDTATQIPLNQEAVSEVAHRLKSSLHIVGLEDLYPVIDYIEGKSAEVLPSEDVVRQSAQRLAQALEELSALESELLAQQS